jgi:hypothetical protein
MARDISLLIVHGMGDTARLRELMLFGFSDAASLEHKKELALSPYWQTQPLIRERLDELFDETGGAAPLAIVAQSLGGQVISNYIWDAQQPRAYAGIWSGDLDDGAIAGYAAATTHHGLQHSGFRRRPRRDRADRSATARRRIPLDQPVSIPTTCSAGRSRSSAQRTRHSSRITR